MQFVIGHSIVLALAIHYSILTYVNITMLTRVHTGAKKTPWVPEVVASLAWAVFFLLAHWS